MRRAVGLLVTVLALPYLQSNWAKVVEHYSSSAESPGKSRGYGTVLGTAIYSGMKYQMGHP